jgi:hypothetical protein
VHIIEVFDLLIMVNLLQVTTAYIDTTLPTDQRQVSLKETYHFDCACSLCKLSSRDSIDLDPRESTWCPRSCGGTCSLPRQGSPSPKCIKCGAGVPPNAMDAILDAIRLGSEGLEKAQTIQGKGQNISLHRIYNPFTDPLTVVQIQHTPSASRPNSSLSSVPQASHPARTPYWALHDSAKHSLSTLYPILL